MDSPTPSVLCHPGSGQSIRPMVSTHVILSSGHVNRLVNRLLRLSPCPGILPRPPQHDLSADTFARLNGNVFLRILEHVRTSLTLARSVGSHRCRSAAPRP